VSLKLEIQKVAEARHDITGHGGGTATEFHHVPLTMQSNIRDKDKRQGSYFVTFTGGMRNPSAHGERVRFGFYRLLFDDKK